MPSTRCGPWTLTNRCWDGCRVLDDPKTDQEEQEESPDSMAIALAAASQRPRADDPFALYIVDSEGPPVVHISRTRRSEVVVFGRTQKLQTPIVLGSGAILLNAADKDDEIEISKIVPSKFGDSDVKLRTSLELGEVIRRVANLGATYPEIVAILEAADRQKNLPGTLVVDAVPSSNADYLAAAILGKAPASKADPAVKRASAQASPSRFRRLFGMRSREAAAPATDALKAQGGTSATGSDTAAPSGPKKDEGVQRAGGDEPSTPSTRLVQATLAGLASSPYGLTDLTILTTLRFPRPANPVRVASPSRTSEEVISRNSTQPTRSYPSFPFDLYHAPTLEAACSPRGDRDPKRQAFSTQASRSCRFLTSNPV